MVTPTSLGHMLLREHTARKCEPKPTRAHTPPQSGPHSPASSQAPRAGMQPGALRFSRKPQFGQ